MIFADQLLESTFICINTKIFSEIVFVYMSYSIKFNIIFYHNYLFLFFFKLINFARILCASSNCSGPQCFFYENHFLSNDYFHIMIFVKINTHQKNPGKDTVIHSLWREFLFKGVFIVCFNGFHMIKNRFRCNLVRLAKKDANRKIYPWTSDSMHVFLHPRLKWDNKHR